MLEFEHDRRGVGIDVNVELRRRCHVAEVHRTAHQYDALDFSRNVRRKAQRQRDVGQRAKRAQRDTPVGRCAQRADDKVDRVPGPRRACGQRNVGPSEAIGAANKLRRRQRKHQWLFGAAIDGHVSALGQRDDTQCVRRRKFDADIAGDCRDAAQIEPITRGEREQDRDRVILARIGVDDDGVFRHRGHKLTRRARCPS